MAPRPADASCIPGFDYAVFTEGGIDISGGVEIDSWNSSVGPYGSSGSCSTDGDIGSNTTTANTIEISNASAEVCGDIFTGAGSTPSSVVDDHPNANITGGQTAQTTNIVLTPPTAPVLPAAAVFNPSSSNANVTLAPEFSYGTVSCSNGSLTLSAGRYVVNTLQLTANCELRLASAPVEFYFTSTLDIGSGTVANTTDIPGNIIFYGTSTSTTVSVQGGVDAYFAVYAPTAACTLQGNADVFGALVCNTAHLQGNGDVHYDKALQNVGGGGFACSPNEVARSTPIALVVEGNANTSIVQGTFETPTSSQTTFTDATTLAPWTFPYLKGHMRARVASTIGTSFASGTVLFDAGSTTAPTVPGGIPAANNAGCAIANTSCRYVFTNTNTAAGLTYLPTIRQLNDANASTIGPLITNGLSGAGTFTNTEWTTIVRRIIAGQLGGVDRSTVAVIEPGTVVGNNRPTIAYFGATDGMLHAVCASTAAGSACPAGSIGKELWAFMPGTQLSLVPSNTTRVDGSVRVLDVFGNFPTAVAGSPLTAPTAATGRRSFKTILLFHTGFGVNTKDAAYALDITNPQQPVVLWEYATPATRRTLDFGTGMAVAAGPTVINGETRNLAVFETSNGGTNNTTHGVVATALEVDTTGPNGDRTNTVWQFAHDYPSPPRGDASDPMPAILATGRELTTPFGAAGLDIDNTRSGLLTHYVFGDIYGSVWRLDATNGQPPTTGSGFSCKVDDVAVTGCVPIFSMSANQRPLGVLPTVFARVEGGDQFVAFASGGYVDPVATLWSTTTQRLIAVKVNPSVLPESDATTACALSTCNLLVNAPFTGGDRGFSAALVVGTKLFVTADSTDVNNASYGTSATATGRIYSADILAGATTTFASTTTIHRGAGSLANEGNTAFTGTGGTQATNTTGGVSVDASAAATITRRLWVRSNTL